eukprot:scaffold2792_cov112-Isochrysis_galbana.AAC.5
MLILGRATPPCSSCGASGWRRRGGLVSHPPPASPPSVPRSSGRDWVAARERPAGARRPSRIQITRARSGMSKAVGGGRIRGGRDVSLS